MPHFWNSKLSKQNKISITRHSTNVFRIFLNISRLLITRDNWAKNVAFGRSELYQVSVNIVVDNIAPVWRWVFNLDCKLRTLYRRSFIVMNRVILKVLYLQCKLDKARTLINSASLLRFLATKSGTNCDNYFHICFFVKQKIIYKKPF